MPWLLTKRDFDNFFSHDTVMKKSDIFRHKIDTFFLDTGILKPGYLPSASTSQKGIVLLDDSTANVSTLTAATANVANHLQKQINSIEVGVPLGDVEFNGTVTATSFYGNLPASNITGTISETNLPTGDTETAGIVRLNDTTTNTSTTMAATANMANHLQTQIDSIEVGIPAGDVEFSGIVTATALYGDLPAGNIIGTVTETNLPTGDTETAGIVRLNDTTTNTSSSIAATANVANYLQTQIDSIEVGIPEGDVEFSGII
jgi:hypothetical protein